MHRSHTCGELTLKQNNKNIKLCGWVHSRRDHGGLIFIDLRDRYGITQVVFRPEVSKELHQQAERLRSEFVIQVEGKVSERPEGTKNSKLKTGEIEITAEKLTIFNESPTPPFEIVDPCNVQEDIRLKYRFLDIRRPAMTQQLEFRYRVTRAVREYLDEQGFIEVETPFLTRSTPEGARDFLVPARLSPGSFYALPQSPQLFKQLLMVAGMDRYFQLVRCFRDEDLRADRQLEHTQIDMELSFVTEDDIQTIVEGMIQQVFKKTLKIDIPTPFPRIPHQEAMNRYGSDKPDLRVEGFEIQDVSEIVGKADFKVFKEVVARGDVVKGLTCTEGADFSRKDIDDLTALAGEAGAKGLAWLKFKGGKWDSPIKKFLSDSILKELEKSLKPEDGSIVFFVADKWVVACEVLGVLRNSLARKFGKIREGYFLSWTVDFPLLEWNEEDKRCEPLHHPFTSPTAEDIAKLEKDPLKVRARAYDLILNGSEVGGGSIRIHEEALQEKVFKAIGINPEEAKEKFSFLLQALKYGAPPHGGIALGLDRLCTMLLGLDSIREVIAFPKTQRGTCLLTEAPTPVSPYQLKELHIKSS